MKGFLALFTWLIISVAQAANVLSTEKDLTLVKGQEFVVVKPSVGAYALNNDNLVKIETKGQRVSFTPRGSGNAVIQVLHVDGSITNYKLRSIPNSETAYFSRTSYYRGYNFIFTGEYLDFKRGGSSGASKAINSNYRGRALLTTRVGTQGKFLGRVEFRENFPLYYYLRGDYKKLYYGYGDLNLQLNPYRPSIITQPRLRQHTVGWDGEKFDLDLWSGQLSPVPFSSSLGLASARPTQQRAGTLTSFNDRFSGGRIRYRFDSGSSMYASTWYNHQNKKSIPYVGYTYINRKYGISNSTTVGNTSDAPVYANRFSYRANKNSFNLQSLGIDYTLAKKGYDNLLFQSFMPYERLGVNTQFYSGDKFTKRGSPFVNLGYGYLLNGFTTNNQYSSSLGWKNSDVTLKVDGAYGTQEFSYMPGEVYHNHRVSPGMELWLNRKKESTWRYRLGLNQMYTKFEYLQGDTHTQETTVRLSAKHQSGLGLSLGVGRFNFRTDKFERNGIRFTPRVDYRKDNIVLYAQGNVTYLTNNIPGENTAASNYALGQERYSGGFKYTYNQKHIFDARYMKAADGINNREYSALVVGYTLKLGHPSKSIVSLLDSKKVYGTIFEDKNLNGVQDKEEKGIKGIKVTVQSEKGDSKSDITDSDGEFKISGLNDDMYSFSTESSDVYSLSNTPGMLNFKSQEGYEVKLPAVKTKNIELSIKGNLEESLYASVDCQDKEGVNKVPVTAGQISQVSVPVNNNCSISINLLGTNENVSVSPDKVVVAELTDSKAEFTINTSKIILGQVFWDKNANGYYEIGEELANAKVIFSSYEMTSDENGIFTTKVKASDKTVRFDRVKGFKCSLRKDVIDDFTGKKIIPLPCRK